VIILHKYYGYKQHNKKIMEDKEWNTTYRNLWWRFIEIL
jgi:hypothetical protein